MCQTYGCDNRSDGTGEEHGYCDPCATARRSERTLRAENARLRAALESIAGYCESNNLPGVARVARLELDRAALGGAR